MKILKTLLRIAISVGLLSYLIYHADPIKILNVLNGIWSNDRTVYLAVATILFILAYIILSFRWQVLVSGYGLKVPTHALNA